MRGLGEVDEDRPFRGHLTVARVKRRRRPVVVGTAFSATFVADRIHLVSSRLGADGARYEVVASSPGR